ncbi:hypothetical protein V3331_14575 [Gaopeijia maritima]|uniref:hypothetical protein n=1 Tax=Gaopeijia maritima TaxID=3119007 RepID=UPI003245A625
MVDVVHDLYGCTLQNQGRGLYVSMELFAMLRGSVLAQEAGFDVRVLPAPDRPTEFFRPAHDFARRVIGGRIEGAEEGLLLDSNTITALRELFEGLQLPVPGRRREPGDWRQRHFYPFPADLVHYDALERRGRVKIEGNNYRGGGGLAHRMLRTDEDVERLKSTRVALTNLFSDSQSPLGSLARALHELDESRSEAHSLWTDRLESGYGVHPSPWVEHLRSGVNLIATRGLPESKAVEALITWVPFCVLRHQESLAFAELERRDARLEPIVVDCLPDNGPLRNRARSDFNGHWTAVRRALELRASDLAARGEESSSTNTSFDNAKSFFAASCYAVGFANSAAGIRWFTASPALLESIVLATVPQAVTFVTFCEYLHRNLGMIFDPRSAQRENITSVDQSTFEDNSEALAEVLHELGLLERFSDTTRMVAYK